MTAQPGLYISMLYNPITYSTYSIMYRWHHRHAHALIGEHDYVSHTLYLLLQRLTRTFPYDIRTVQLAPLTASWYAAQPNIVVCVGKMRTSMQANLCLWCITSSVAWWNGTTYQPFKWCAIVFASYCTLDAVPATHDTAFLVEAILLQMEAVQREVDLTGVSEEHGKAGVESQ